MLQLVNVRERFERDVAEWQRETEHLSVVDDFVNNNAYRRIIGLGPAAVPLIIERLRKKPEHWLVALKAIVGKDPAAGVTSLAEGARCWVEWYDREWATLTPTVRRKLEQCINDGITDAHNRIVCPSRQEQASYAVAHLERAGLIVIDTAI